MTEEGKTFTDFVTHKGLQKFSHAFWLVNAPASFNRIMNFATVAVLLTDLTKKDQPNQLKWSGAQHRAFETLKSCIVKPPILRLPDFEKQFVLQTDASNTGIGAILLQEESGVKHPVDFASRKLLTRESHCSTIEKECLAIVWAIQKEGEGGAGCENRARDTSMPNIFPIGATCRPCVANKTSKSASE